MRRDSDAPEERKTPMTNRPAPEAALRRALSQRILVLDGAWAAMLQARNLGDDDFRRGPYAGHRHDLKGNFDVLNVTRPDVIANLHDAYFAAGADIASTNTFTSTAISQADYGLAGEAPALARAGARIARARADAWTARTPDQPRFVAGSIGPMNHSLSISGDVNDPAARSVVFDVVYAAYRQQAIALLDGGVDLFLLETVFDTLNAKAAIKAILDLEDERAASRPMWISATITDLSGRTLSGQTLEAFWISVRHARPLIVGLNCALGAALMDPHLADLSRLADTFVAAHPNAGLPNAFGGYDETPAQTAALVGNWARRGLLNVVGGCCGTTPAHIAAIAEAVSNLAPRLPATARPTLRLAGLESVEL